MLKNQTDWTNTPGHAALSNEIGYVNGRIGSIWRIVGQERKAIATWLADLRALRVLERHLGKRWHKGWWYFSLYQAYLAIGDKQKATVWLKRARREDIRTYGKKRAAEFPAAEASIP